MAKEYLVEVLGCDDSTELIIRVDDTEFAVIKKLTELVTETSSIQCQPTMFVREATESDKRRLKDE